jgi:hypothetical protein
MQVNILGTEYKVLKHNYDEIKAFEKSDINGYCDTVNKHIVICNMATYPGYEDESEDFCKVVEKDTLRHEIVHSFLRESGVWANSGNVDSWATNEEMVDWIALQFPKMLKAFNETNCL